MATKFAISPSKYWPHIWRICDWTPRFSISVESLVPVLDKCWQSVLRKVLTTSSSIVTNTTFITTSPLMKWAASATINITRNMI
jgi:hypothetical protein